MLVLLNILVWILAPLDSLVPDLGMIGTRRKRESEVGKVGQLCLDKGLCLSN